jgi:hypothetical protein
MLGSVCSSRRELTGDARALGSHREACARMRGPMQSPQARPRHCPISRNVGVRGRGWGHCNLQRWTGTQAHRYTHGRTQTHTDTHMGTQSCRHTQTHTDTHRHTQARSDTHRHAQTHTDTHRHTQTHTGTHRHTHRHTQTHTSKRQMSVTACNTQMHGGEGAHQKTAHIEVL